MHAQISKEAQEIAEKIRALPTADRLMLIIDLCEITAALNERKEENTDPAIAAAEVYKARQFVHHGATFNYVPPLPMFNYKNNPKWVAKKKELESIEQQSKESLIAQRKGLDIKGMMPPPNVTFRRASISIAFDGEVKSWRRNPFMSKRGVKKADTSNGETG